MPGTAGGELARRVREQSAYDRIQIVIMPSAGFRICPRAAALDSTLPHYYTKNC